MLYYGHMVLFHQFGVDGATIPVAGVFQLL